MNCQKTIKTIYQVGSMGGASAMGLGVALNTERPVVVIDGDGAALMHLGAFKTIGDMGPTNLKHIVINNGMHDSVGGQPSKGFNVDTPKLAEACGYHESRTASTVSDLCGVSMTGKLTPLAPTSSKQSTKRPLLISAA